MSATHDPRHRRFVGNLDHGIHVQPPRLVVQSIDDAFSGHTTGALARKCIEVGPRAMHLLGPNDAAVLYRPLAEDYAAYCEALYGFRPRIFAPHRHYTNYDEPLSLLEWVLGDEELLAVLAEEGQRFGWSLDAFIGHPLVFELARKTDLPVAGLSEESVNAGAVGDLNDKALFQKICHELGIPTPPSTHVIGWGELMCETKRLFERDGSVMLRRSRATGGLGNCEVNAELLRQADCDSVAAYLEKMLEPHEEWATEPILVEPVLDLATSPSTLFRVDGERIRLAATIDQVLKDKRFIGGTFPTTLPHEVTDQLVAWGQAYGREFVTMGGQGWFDIDWGVLIDGSIVAFESNARWTGNNHGLATVQRLRPDNVTGVVAWTNDAFKVAPDTTLAAALAHLAVHGIAWNQTTGEGVVITIPPAGDDDVWSMGYIAIAETRVRAHAMRDAMNEFVWH